MSNNKVRLFLRDETKGNERRTPITPVNAKKLIDSGKFEIFVQRWKDRIFSDEEYEKVGCKLVDDDSVVNDDTFVLGLKNLPKGDSPISNKHVYFAHAFKNQFGWSDLLKRFHNGKGVIYDIEFLVDENGRRVAAFGHPAGFAGCALGLLAWAHQQISTEPLGPVSSFDTADALIAHIYTALEKAAQKVGRYPKVIIIGALGRVGRGAQDVLKKVEEKYASEQKSTLTMDKLLWDLDETKKGGPFPEILDCDIFVNCIYLMGKIPPFLTNDLISQKGRKLSVVVDVSCDYDNPNNPLPIYDQATSWEKPTLKIREKEEEGGLLEVVSIDNLPSLIPRESSEAFGNDLEPHWYTIDSGDVWQRAKKVFDQKTQEAIST